MLNADKLVGAIYAKGFNKGSFAKAMNKQGSWLTRKIKTGKFTLAEANEIVEVLGLSAEEATAIFFDFNVA